MSPAATIDPALAKSQVLDAADRIFYARGIAGAGMSEIRDAAGVSMRRLYAAHPTKRDLVAAWLEDRHVRWMLRFTGDVERHIDEGMDPVPAVFEALADWTASPGYRGCAFLNALAEPAEIDDRHREIIAAHKRSLVDFLATVVARATDEAPVWLPPALAVLVDGAIVQSAAFASRQPVDDARTAAEHLMKALS
jgi:AcrR family transcriptional regulator